MNFRQPSFGPIGWNARCSVFSPASLFEDVDVFLSIRVFSALTAEIWKRTWVIVDDDVRALDGLRYTARGIEPSPLFVTLQSDTTANVHK